MISLFRTIFFFLNCFWCVNMSECRDIDWNSDIIAARIDGILCRAEKAGFDAGRKKGISDGKLEIARNMLEKGFSLDDIVDVTGLSEKDILNAE